MAYQLFRGYSMPKFDSFVKVWYICLTSYQLIMGYLIPKFDLFVKLWFNGISNLISYLKSKFHSF